MANGSLLEGVQASSRLMSFRSANALLCIPQGTGNLEEGTLVDAYVIGHL
jgi:molybdopterin biosynthesis enzyme